MPAELFRDRIPRRNESGQRFGDGSTATEIEYKFTLVDLNQRSYYLLHETDEIRMEALIGDSRDLALFRQHLRQAILLANLEVCAVRNWQLAAKDADDRPQNYCINLGRAAPATPHAASKNAAAAADEQQRIQNYAALRPVVELLALEPTGLRAGAGTDLLISKHRLAEMLDVQIRAADELLDQEKVTAALQSCPDTVLLDLAYSFAAYQPAALDEELKGSQSPYDPRSNTKSIRDVRRLVRGSVREAGAIGPSRLAHLAMKLLRSVASRPEFPFAQYLLQSGCQSGHSELVELLLNARLPSLYELDIIRRLRNSWVGYRAYRPLQPDVRQGPLAQTLDWLDFKCSCARAVIIAHKVIETVIVRDDQDLTQSLQFGYATGRGPALLNGGAAGRGGGAADAAGDLGASLAASTSPQAHAAGKAVAEGVEDESPPQSVAAAEPSQSVAAAGGHGGRIGVIALSAPPPRASLGAYLLDSRTPAELEERKWRLVMILFQRPAACKPLALAILHVVLSGKREVNRLWRKRQKDDEKQREAAAVAAAAAAAGGGPPARSETASTDGEEESSGDESESQGDAAVQEEAEAAAQQKAEEDRARRYQKLHRLAVQACHLAVHSSSLSTVSDAIQCIRAVRAWPAIDLQMLNDLAEHFPQQCAQLLEAVPLQVVDLEDNVLPFGLPPGFLTVAVSEKDSEGFAEGGGSGSTQDAEHFATQREEDATIDASLLVMGRTWLALLFLFWPSEFRSLTTQKLLRVGGCAVAAFLYQGPGSVAVAAVFLVLLAVLGVLARVMFAIVRILILGIFDRLWKLIVQRVPWVGHVVTRVAGMQGSEAGNGGSGAVGPGAVSTRVAPSGLPRAASVVAGHSRTGPMVNGPPATKGNVGAAGHSSRRGLVGKDGGDGGDGEGGGGNSSSDEESDTEGFTAHLGRGLWRGLFAHGHNAVIDGALGWGKGSASISCRKVPFPIMYASRSRPSAKGGLWKGRGRSGRPGQAGGAAPLPRQLDTSLMEKLLKAPGVHPSVFGSRVLRALILFKWNYFTKYFIILQFLLHVTYMGVFLAYAFTIKDMEPVDGREEGPGANTPGCQLQAPTRVQTALLGVLAIMTVDFTIQELRQIRHFGLMFFSHTWDVLDVSSIALVVASITLHFSCTSDVSPLVLRGLAAVQIVLLFMRLLYYAMASDKLGSFVRMVLETTYDLMMFFAFLSVVFVGFALAIIISQGPMADIEQTFIKLFTMMYGDFDVSYLSTLESGALGLDAITRVLASLYMIMVTIILLNLLISIISESYERIRENERWESLRNKALLVVESETQLYQRFLAWLYTKLTEPTGGSGGGDKKSDGKRFLYVIAPEYARRAGAADDDEDDEDDEDEGDEEDEDDGQWNGRLGEMKRHIIAAGRSTLEGIKKELKALDRDSGQGAMAGGPNNAGAANAGDFDGGGTPAAPRPVVLDAATVQLISTHVGALVGEELAKLRSELLTGSLRASGKQHPVPVKSRLVPLPAVPGATGSGAGIGAAGARQAAAGVVRSGPAGRTSDPGERKAGAPPSKVWWEEGGAGTAAGT